MGAANERTSTTGCGHPGHGGAACGSRWDGGGERVECRPSDRRDTGDERGWMRALRIRSEALNRIYVLAPMHALEIRGEALNRINGLDDGERFQAGGS
jgi:hypothetical protein